MKTKEQNVEILILEIMKEEIDWKKELLESKKFNNQFSKNILENGAKNYMQGIYMGYMYHRWKKIREKSIP